MADQGVFWKLWCSALEDPDLDNLDIADFGRWAKLGAYMKKHGNDGNIVIRRPAKSLLCMLQLPDFDAFLAFLKRISHVHVTCESESAHVTNAIVTYENWKNYQGDMSRERMRRLRANVTIKKRGEEKRGEEKRLKENSSCGAAKESSAGASNVGEVAKGEEPSERGSEAEARGRSGEGRKSAEGEAKPKPTDPDRQWREGLRANPAYTGLDIEAVYGKLVAWCEIKHKQPTRLRLLNWLNREERPLNPTPNRAEKGDHEARERFMEMMKAKL